MASMQNNKKEKSLEFDALDLIVIDPKQDKSINLKDLVKGRPAILSFIMGTWCPKCDKYIQGLIAASELLNTNTGPEVFIVSTEPNKKLRNYFGKNGCMSELPFRVVSDKSKSLINAFGLKFPVFGFAKPAAVLVQNDQSWRVISKGLPSEEQLTLDIECSFLQGNTQNKQPA